MSRLSLCRAPLLAAPVLFGLSATATAHEFWVEPSAFSPAAGGRIGVRLCVGDGFEGWSLPRSSRRIEKFVAVGSSGELPIVGLDGSDPAGVARFTVPGSYVSIPRTAHERDFICLRTFASRVRRVAAFSRS